MGGALRDMYEAWRTQLKGCLAHAEAVIDFGDDEVGSLCPVPKCLVWNFSPLLPFTAAPPIFFFYFFLAGYGTESAKHLSCCVLNRVSFTFALWPNGGFHYYF